MFVSKESGHENLKMKTHYTLLFIFFFSTIVCLARNENDSLLNALDKTLLNKSIYVDKKERDIKKIKLQFTDTTSIDHQYQLNQNLIAEYWSYICDSALFYINKNTELAEKTKNNEWLIESKIQSSFVLASSGLFVESLAVLKSIKRSSIPKHLLEEYYKAYQRLYSNQAKYIDDKNYSIRYSLLSKQYTDSISAVLPIDSEQYKFEYWRQVALHSQDNVALDSLKSILSRSDSNIHQYAMNADRLSHIYEARKDKKQQEKYLIIAALTDTKLVVKENEALLKLAVLINQQGDVERAYRYIQTSVEDANFFNTRFRNTVIGKVQPIIEKSYLLKIEQQSQNLKTYSIIISILVIGLCITIFFIYKQIKIVSRARKNLKDMNLSLQELNKKLDEVNHIKEEYIGYFLNQCSLYIDKLDEYRKLINRKITAGQFDDLYKLTLSSHKIDQDIEELYQNFDEAFLRIFPNFVKDFNSLLKEDEHYKVKPGELNTELRIFALIRLGITDSNQISAFLRYSLRTIYNYRSKVKGKACIETDNFEEKVKTIGLL